MKATRKAYGETLAKIGRNKKIVVLSADLSPSTKTNIFEEKYPERGFQCGVAEQNMVGMAAGLATEGKIPFVSSFAAFVPARTVDQIRVSVCYSKLNVKFASTHAGLTVGEDGATHQMLEDIAIMRALPNMTVIVPCDAAQTSKAVVEAARMDGPVYLRLGRSKVPCVTDEKSSFRIGKADVLRKGKDITIIACGIMVAKALEAADRLKQKGVDAEVINCHTIKPLDESAIVRSVRKTGCVVSAEEHQIYGGLGSAVAECLSKKNPAPMEMVAVKDKFGESGGAEELLKKYGLTPASIIAQSMKVLRRKS